LVLWISLGRSPAFVEHPDNSVEIDVAALTVAQPKLVCELDVSELKGQVRRLSWAPNGESIHVQTLEGELVHDYIITLADGVVSLAFGEPQWAAYYWATKSALAAPGIPALQIEVIQENQRTRPQAFSGGFANGGAQTWDPKNASDAFAVEVTARLLGQEVGHWVNGFPMAGESYGWGPADSGAIVFVDDKGRLVLLDRSRHKQTIRGTKDALLPAWSMSGAHVAYLEKNGRKKYRLMTAALGAAR
jgi:hypothetical protein